AAAVDSGEALVEADFGVEARSDDVETARRTAEAIEGHRPLAVRMAGDYGDREVGAQILRRAFAGGDAGARNRDAALETAAQAPRALRSDSHGPERRGERDAAVGDVEDDVGKRERLVAGRRQHLVDLTPADLAVDQP